MSVETIRCPECGFSATYVKVGKQGQLKEELLGKASRCVKTDSYKDAKKCPEFAAAMKAKLGFTI